MPIWMIGAADVLKMPLAPRTVQGAESGTSVRLALRPSKFAIAGYVRLRPGGFGRFVC